MLGLIRWGRSLLGGRQEPISDVIEAGQTGPSENYDPVQLAQAPDVSAGVGNDAPNPGDLSKTGETGEELHFTLSDFTKHLPDEEASSLIRIKIKTLPDDGALEMATVLIHYNRKMMVD